MGREKKTRMRARRLLTVAAIALGALGGGMLTAAPAQAASVRDGVAYAEGAGTSPSALAASLKVEILGGLLGGVLAPVTNLVENILNPLLTTVNTLPTTLLAALAPTANGANAMSAGTPVDAAASSAASRPFSLLGGNMPAYGAPSSCTAGSGTCFWSPGGINVPTSLVGLKVGGTSGLTEFVQTPTALNLSSQASASGISASLLGLVDLVQADLVTSSAMCSANGGTSTAGASSFSSVGLLNGLVQAKVGADGKTLSATVAGAPVSASPVTVPIGVPGLSAAVTLSGNLLKAQVIIGLQSLLTSLGLGALGAGVSGTDANVTLNIAIGPETTTTGSRVTATGLHVAIGLSAAIALDVNLLGAVPLAKVSLAIGGGDPASNLLDLRLAQSSCATSTYSTTGNNSWVPAGRT